MPNYDLGVVAKLLALVLILLVVLLCAGKPVPALLETAAQWLTLGLLTAVGIKNGPTSGA